MTRDEILKMEAGRELDALVAKDVMGWHKLDGNWKDNIWEKADGHIKGDWHPSEDISAAWEVVTKIRSMGWGVDISWFHEFIYCALHKPDSVIIKQANAETAPLAICRAALLAVMENDK